MSANLSPEQLERISAYLDGMLPVNEARQMQDSAKHDASLQAELDELNKTRQLLRNLPSVQIPRSFTLRPEQVHPQAQLWSPRWFKNLQWASAVMATLLVMVVSANFYFSGNLSATPTLQSNTAAEGELGNADSAYAAPIAEILETPPQDLMVGAASAPEASVTEIAPMQSSEMPIAADAAPAETEVAKVAVSAPETSGTEIALVQSSEMPIATDAAPAETENPKIAGSAPEATPEAEILTADAPPLQSRTINPMVVALRVASVVIAIMLFVSLIVMFIVRSRTAR
jgi:anti-sigma factor RsiW